MLEITRKDCWKEKQNPFESLANEQVAQAYGINQTQLNKICDQMATATHLGFKKALVKSLLFFILAYILINVFFRKIGEIVSLLMIVGSFTICKAVSSVKAHRLMLQRGRYLLNKLSNGLGVRLWLNRKMNISILGTANEDRKETETPLNINSINGTKLVKLVHLRNDKCCSFSSPICNSDDVTTQQITGIVNNLIKEARKDGRIGTIISIIMIVAAQIFFFHTDSFSYWRESCIIPKLVASAVLILLLIRRKKIISKKIENELAKVNVSLADQGIYVNIKNNLVGIFYFDTPISDVPEDIKKIL